MQAKPVRPLIIAHRGASAFAPENTLAAFQKAIESGADGIELDVRLAKDVVPVVFHDATLVRLAKIKRSVSDCTAEELSKIDVGSWFNRAFPRRADDKFSAEIVPTFAELLDFLSGYKGLVYVELKGKNQSIPALAETVCRMIKETSLLPNVIVKSFNLEGIKIVKEILPEARTAALFEPKILTVLRKRKLILDEAQKYRADELSLHYSLATKKFVRQAREKGFSTIIWTADNPAWIRRALNFGIDAVITDNPARLLDGRKKIFEAN